MKKITKSFLLLAAIVAWGSAFSYVSAAKQYCHEPITAGGKTIYLSCETISVGNYRITIESDIAMTNLSAGCYANVNGVGGYQLIASPGYVRASDGKKITIDIPSTSAPNLYTPLYVLFPGEQNFGSWPTSDIIWTGTCVVGPPDTEAPTDFTATKGAVDGSSVELLLKATDNSGSVTYTVTYGSTSFDVIGTSNVEKSHIVTGLMLSTAYSFSIVAKDAAGNSIPTPIVVDATTTAQPTNLIVNGDFASGITNWVFSSTGTVTDGEAYFSTANAAGNPWDTELKQTGKSFTLGTSYTLTFRARAAADRNISVNIQNTNIWSDQFRNNAVALTTTMTTYTFIFVATSTNTNAQLNFHMGNMGTNTTAAVYIDDVSLIVSPTADTTPPDMGTATVVGSPAFNSVNLLLTATDNVTSPVTSFVANDATNGITDKAFTADASGNGTVSGLTASTSYNLVIKAKDASGNISANSTTVSFTTPAAPAVTTINFEPAGVGQDWTWTVGENGTNPALEFVDNPSTIGINPSSKVAKFTATATGNAWALVYSSSSPYVISADNKIIKVMVYKDRISDFGLKLETTTGALELKVANTLINTWEVLTFDFSSKIGSTVNTIVFIPDFLARTVETINYFDNISFSNGVISSLGSNKSDNSVRCYPNPMNNTLNVSSSTEINQVIVRNMLGQTIKTINVNQLEKSIDLSTVSTGNYFVTVKLANGQLSTQKFVKL